ncbi:macrolide family glycosyltransferase [Spongiactinospora sp. TRM90649]|uniref:macrolide family glycosyltransferase n=1 Tax=Spongiactinospora sp. TRM90649 TaxID=3031114 RepID=UPI0023F684B6|nr:macrolide family glycosyltransferase [Spongiactinospora sp. TRM90649]MDF5759270.1 glycosyltransferase [Spongiactinospora sp. TRM90649]
MTAWRGPPPNWSVRDGMASIAFFNNSGYGHVLPTLGVVAELVRRGHRVTYFTGAGVTAKVAATGAEVVPYETRLPGIDLSEYVTADRTPELLGIYLTESETILRAAEAHFGDTPPDLIEYDLTVYHAGRILAAKWGIPAVQGLPVFASNDHFSLLDAMVRHMGKGDPRHPALLEFVRRLTALLAAHGQADTRLEDFIGQNEGLNLAYFPRSFQFAGPTFDDRFAFIGPGLEDDPAPGGWTPPGDGRPVLFVSLGTSVNRRPGFFRACVDAFRDQPWHVVMTVHQGVDRAELEPLPSNVEVHEWLAHQEVLRHTDVLLCHAGMGSLMGAWHQGVPAVVVPGSPEDWVNARRVAELGLGRVIREDLPTPDRLRAAVLGVAADQMTRKRVDRMRTDIATAGGGVRGADAIEHHLTASLVSH